VTPASRERRPRRRDVSLGTAVLAALAGGLAVGVVAGVSALRREEAAAAAVTLAVTPVQSTGGAAYERIADRLTVALHREFGAPAGAGGGRVRVVEWRRSMSYDRAARVVRDGVRPVTIDLVLEGGVETGPTGMRATFQVVSTATGSVSWTRSYALGNGAGVTSDEAIDHVAREVAEVSRALAPPRD
jgi:TolB-like protein